MTGLSEKIWHEKMKLCCNFINGDTISTPNFTCNARSLPDEQSFHLNITVYGVLNEIEAGLKIF